MKITKFFALLGAVAFAFAACEQVNNGGDNNGPQQGGTDGPDRPEPTGSITLSADKLSVAVGEVVTFTVTDAENQDVTSQANIYDAELNVVKSGQWTAATTGVYEFFATVGSENSNYVKVSVMAEVPEIPENPEPENLAFNHRAILVDFTGVNCGFCPDMIDELIKLEKTSWGPHFNEVTCHAGTYAGGDPANSAAANSLNQYYGGRISGYPTLIMNFNGTGISRDYNAMASTLQGYIQLDGADVGISMAVCGDSENVYFASEIKAAKTNEYRATAWLLESDIYSPNQSGATKPEHYIYDFAIRNGLNITRSDISGEDLGTIEAGKSVEYSRTLGITSKTWVADNLGVIVIVSAKDKNNRWEVVNSLYCPVNESKAFEFVTAE
ncbi:MAG: Omp28-related outer membrane protein [Alistipes sp.]|nr:Omp28-related outer membrane protein [Alistipes sp.]